MNENKLRSWFAWTLPLLISVGLALGALIGFSLFGEMIRPQGAGGDLGGAAGALMVLIAGAMGFFMSLLTVVVAKIRQQTVWNYVIRRIGLSIAGGTIIGPLGANDGSVATTAAWLLLVCLPIACTWPWSLHSSA